MKKTISAVALLASSASYAKPLPADSVEFRTLCLPSYENAEGVLVAQVCDETKNNEDPKLNREVTASGCTADQIVVNDVRYTYDGKVGEWGVDIPNCPNPNISQL